MVAINRGDWACARVRDVATRAVISRYGRVRGISVLFENSGAPCTGTLSRVCKRSDHRRNEARPGGGDAWRRLVDGELRLASGFPWNWFSKPGMVARLDQMDAAAGDACTFSRGISPCY